LTFQMLNSSQNLLERSQDIMQNMLARETKLFLEWIPKTVEG
jgi:hypothetical protein